MTDPYGWYEGETYTITGTDIEVYVKDIPSFQVGQGTCFEGQFVLNRMCTK